MVGFKEFIEEKEAPFVVYLDLDGCLVNFMGGIRKNLKKYIHQKPILKGLDVPPDREHEIEKVIGEHLIKKGIDPKVAKHKGIAYFWAIIYGFDLMKSQKKMTPEEKQEKDRRELDFWKNLEWMPDGKKLWDFVKNLKSSGRIKDVKVLSSPSDSPLCEVGKRHWVKENLGLEGENVIIKKEKWEESSSPYDILIDDTPKKLVGDKKVPGWATEGGTPIHHKKTSSTIDSLKSVLKMDLEGLELRSRKVIGKMRQISDVYFVLEESFQHLLAMVVPKFENHFSGETKEVFDHHVTIYYKPTLEQWNFITSILNEGDELEGRITGRHWCEEIGAEAFTIDLYKDGKKIEVKDRILHITHSLKEGVGAKESNKMLVSPKKESEEVSLKVKGKIVFDPIK